VILLAAHVSDDLAACRWEDRQAEGETCAIGVPGHVTFVKTLAAPAVESASVILSQAYGRVSALTGVGAPSEKFARV
jgi:hypothetical protein